MYYICTYIWTCLVFFLGKNVTYLKRLTRITKKSWFQLCENYSFRTETKKSPLRTFVVSKKREKVPLCEYLHLFASRTIKAFKNFLFSVAWNAYFPRQSRPPAILGESKNLAWFNIDLDGKLWRGFWLDITVQARNT